MTWLFAFILQQSSPPASSPGCKVHARDASVVRAKFPVYTDTMKAQDVGRSTIVLSVTIDEKGKAVAADVVQSSGFKDVDAAVVDAALQSTYAPKTLECTPVTSRYLFVVQYNSDS
ncbi:MAG TPA: TonB family protein [Candidatus Baltobacteraceae bacterium]|jgi:TonB family protein|nr:TonB family protein [Candidatus Baltobacteraceae bacterium]